jgi:diguanylate cyclase (GGDEF)-like protein
MGGALWMVCSVFGIGLLSLSPPTASPLADWGYTIAAAILIAGLIGGHGLIKRGHRVTNDELYCLCIAALAMTALMEYLAGGRDTPWHAFYFIAVLYTSAVHPPRRALAYLPLYLLAATSTALHGSGWTAAEVGEIALEIVVTTGVAVLTIVVMDAVRGDRTSLEQEGTEARHLAHVDPLTNLGNRRALMAELETATPSEAAPLCLALYDLDGFKSYNDSFGHVAGDILLQRLADRLRETVKPDGHAFRMGGDEFCVTTRLPETEAEALILRAHGALTDIGEGFRIQASYGWYTATDATISPSDLLREADRGMYARKTLSRVSAGTQTTDVLLSALAERSAELGAHVHDVRHLCDAVADELQLGPVDKAPLLQAASLHDVGKVAIPDSILDKPGPLTDDEWDLMRTHTIIGERILGAAPALTEAAKIVRSTHERYDGWGYPDALAADEIPLGARVIAVCDAYDAMVSPRPYRTPVSPAEAIEELTRCSGGQFDPRVVDAFKAVHAKRPASDDLALSD